MEFCNLKLFVVISAVIAPGQPHAPVQVSAWKFGCTKVQVGNLDLKAGSYSHACPFWEQVMKTPSKHFFHASILISCVSEEILCYSQCLTLLHG